MAEGQDMNNSELASRVASRASLSRADADRAVDAMLSVIGDALANGETVRIAGFGRFTRTERPAREGRQPAHRRAHRHRPIVRSVVQGRQGAQGSAQLMGHPHSARLSGMWRHRVRALAGRECTTGPSPTRETAECHERQQWKAFGHGEEENGEWGLNVRGHSMHRLTESIAGSIGNNCPAHYDWSMVNR